MRSYPHLLRGIEIARLNRVWAMDITYIPMARGFVYLAVVLDWFSRSRISMPNPDHPDLFAGLQSVPATSSQH